MKTVINIALAGYANVGKSVIFNWLTGLHQHIGNWPGKTIEKAEGTLHYKGYTINVLDLPGVCSLSSYSIEEIITRDHIISQKPDALISVVDSVNLETNLMLTLQLLELDRNTVIALNMVDSAKKRGILIDHQKLSEILGVPVIPMAATLGKGIAETLDKIIETIRNPTSIKRSPPKYGKEVEERVEKLVASLHDRNFPYPSRFLAIKLLEKDEEIVKLNNLDPDFTNYADKLILELENIHGHDSSVLIADERSTLASRITKEVITFEKYKLNKFMDAVESLTAHKILGYPIMFLVLGLMFTIVFSGGSYLAKPINSLSLKLGYLYQQYFSNSFLFSNIIWSGLESFLALIEIAFPTILPFYLLLFILEDCGYLARVAYLMDNFMHKVGIHGKACMPLMLGLGCNVPACLGCRIMETERERFITGLLAVFVPCSATTIVISGLVGKTLGTWQAMGLYLSLFGLIFIVGKIAALVVPGEPTELIMKMPSYKLPNFKTILMQTWIRLREFIFVAAPFVIIAGIIINGFIDHNLFAPINKLLAPITVAWLKLPAITGILLILGILRKELILVTLATILGTTDFATILSKDQILTLAVVSMLYIPCMATIAALYKEFGWKKALLVTTLKVLLAIGLAGCLIRIRTLF